MAIPVARSSVVRLPLHLALLTLCVLCWLASVLQPERLLSFARIALHGLAAEEALEHEALDVGDLPAMDPLLAAVVDPRPALAHLLTSRAPRMSVPSFDYISPAPGVLHPVRWGETLPHIAQRYGTTVTELLEANGLDEPYALLPGDMLVVPLRTASVTGGSASLPSWTLREASSPASIWPTSVPTATRPPSRAAATATADALHVSLVGTAVALPRDDLPLPMAATTYQREFILSLAGAAQESQRITGVPASVTLAQAILESDWGRSRLAREAKNLFGIKAHTRPGTAGVYNINAWEVLGGANVIKPESFKAYSNLADSIVDHGRWFHQQPRYSGALAVRDEPQAFARAINEAGYATDPAYANKLIRLMDRFDLYAYDLR